MKVVRVKNKEEISKKAFEIMHELVTSNPKAVLGLATGSSPVGLYELMIRDHKENGTSYKDVTTFNLDEYVGLPKDHPESYYSFMHRNLFDGLDVKEENIHIPSSEGDLEERCDEYNEALSKQTIDLQILGIGSNGHIGFNEPDTPFDSVTHIVDLKESTIKDNARFFDDDISKVPTQAITMGISNVMAAKKIILIANGENKANAIRATVMGPVDEKVPASVLQNHPDVVIIIDEEAGSSLYKEKR
ncbi:MAG: glucosamine-6-phosphate deaminase [Erysipelotrichaceae bacterium]|nr:glucosamine-6-phosphate deaminase [Erysipelotrichaceae bacterium]